jgi:hypothetical protein
MVKVGELYLGGSEGHPTTKTVFLSGVAFYLTQSSILDEIAHTEYGNWEIEVKKNHHTIVARSTEIFPLEHILSEAYSNCQKFLDLLSVYHHNTTVIKNPGTDFIAVFNQNGKSILRASSNANLGINITVTATVRDKDGNIKESPQEPKPKWNQAFRYYRLSQSSSDLYEAYRNLFLSFESLLHGICPINPGEGETRWFTRAMTEVMKKVPLENYVPQNTTDPVRYLVGMQYEHIRCKMFHSKDRGYLLPSEDLDPKNVSDAYQTLIGLWRETVVKFSSQSIGGSVVTYQGFKIWMDNAAALGYSMYVTKKPIKEVSNVGSLISALANPTQINPPPSCFKKFLSSLHQRKYLTNELVYSGEYRPGMVLYRGTYNQENLSKLDFIHGIGMIINNNLINVSNIEDGIKLAGVDAFESDLTLRLINKSSPKTIFS